MNKENQLICQKLIDLGKSKTSGIFYVRDISTIIGESVRDIEETLDLLEREKIKTPFVFNEPDEIYSAKDIANERLFSFGNIAIIHFFINPNKGNRVAIKPVAKIKGKPKFFYTVLNLETSEYVNTYATSSKHAINNVRHNLEGDWEEGKNSNYKVVSIRDNLGKELTESEVEEYYELRKF